MAPQIITQPVDASIPSGSNSQLTVLANGIPNPTYQWYKDDIEISGAVSTSLIFVNMQPENTGIYKAVATNSEGSATSNDAVVFIADPIAPMEDPAIEDPIN
jgi:hypothetical protein